MSRLARDFEMLERIRRKIEQLVEDLEMPIDDFLVDAVLDILQDEYVRLAEARTARRTLIGVQSLP